MPRCARKVSASLYMHVIERGIGKQLLFEDDYDYRYYLKKLEFYCMETDVRVCAYCLMDNHVHLLVKGEAESITLLMKKIGVSYSWHYNKKYERVGHLFQDRYKSEPIENEASFLRVFRYILKNPQKAGICSAVQYRWNSYRLYEHPLPFMDLSVIRGLLGDFSRYKEYIEQEDKDSGLEFSEARHNDAWAKEEMTRCLGIPSGAVLQNYGKKERDAALVRLKERGLSVRQISRLTGIGRNIVQAAGNVRLYK
ncbi:MAG: transposase [Lachnospiraceae bacterium]|nr:transposase [Lachnospiraceae bacterium]